MEREIAFRGKVLRPDPMNNPADGWVEGYYYQDMDGGEVSHFLFNTPCEWRIDPKTLGQYTGLQDRKRKKIYEGDIVRLECHGQKQLCAVRWNEKIGAWCVVLDEEAGVGGYPLGKWMDEVEVRVVGNIHDDPGLLKGLKKQEHYV